MPMDKPADVANAGFKHPMGGGVGHHQGRQAISMHFRLGRQILLIDVAVGITDNRHHLQACHHSAGGIGAVSAGWDQTDIAVVITT